ncbi:MAG: RHS repeat-associated core domain-containing protein [Bacteriovoracia bacterium]
MERMLSCLFLTLILIVGPAWADFESHDGLRIYPDYPLKAFLEGESPQFAGSLCFPKDRGEGKLKCEDLDKLLKRYDLRFFYPDYGTEVTEAVLLNDSPKGINYSYTGQALSKSSQSSLTVVLEPKYGKSFRRKHLLKKIEALSKEKVSPGLKKALEKIISKFNKAIGESPVLAQVDLPVAIHGQISRERRQSTLDLFHKIDFKFDRGDIYAGEKARFSLDISVLKREHPHASYELYLDQVLISSGQISQTGVSFEQVISNSDLVSGAERTFELYLTKSKERQGEGREGKGEKSEKDDKNEGEKNRKKRHPVVFTFPVLQDIVAPDFSPFEVTEYTQFTPAFTSVVSDREGRIAKSDLSLNLSGTKYTGEAITLSTDLYNIFPLAIEITQDLNGEGPGAFDYEIKSTFPDLPEGIYEIKLSSSDFAGNVSQPVEKTFHIDRTPPLIQLGISDNILTNNPAFTIPVSVTDYSPISTRIWHNGEEVSLNEVPSFDVNITLHEGINFFLVESTDAAGNKSSVQLSNIVLDTIPPELLSISPNHFEVLRELLVKVNGTANEALSSAIVNDEILQLDGASSFSTSFMEALEGPKNLEITITDLAGNITNEHIAYEILLKLLRIEMVSVSPTEDGSLKVEGAAGAAKAGVDLKIDGGFFNTVKTKSGTDGSFSALLDYFYSARITASDEKLNRTESYDIYFNVDTTLSGIVKDPSDLPLPGVKVTILSSNQSTITDAQGVFKISNPALGDQQVIIDGTVIPVEVTQNLKEYSKVSINVAIGNRQQNILERPIYISPKMKDGTETQILSGEAALVESPHAPGVSIEIPANTAIFPGGVKTGSINMMEVKADKTSVELPSAIDPGTVYALEPSGLKFSQPVKLTLPNTNDFPEGMELIILSKNSETGLWEVNGSATVAGNKIETKPGEGITHFSEVFAAPFGMELSKFGPKDRPGIQNNVGELSTSVSLPSYTRLGKSIGPKLIYKSSWATPTTVVSNVFNLPRKYYDSKASVSQGSIAGKVKYSEHIQTWLTPESIHSQLFVGDFSSNRLSFTASKAPESAVVSYAVDMSQVDTGIYPSLADYEIKYRTLTIRTTKLKSKDAFGKTKTTVKSFVDQDLLESIFPPELRSFLFHQNKRNSEFGAGWKLAAAQRIYNPDQDRIMVENEDGAVSSYVLKNSVETVVSDANGIESFGVQDGLINYADEKGAVYSAQDGSSPQLQFQTAKYTGDLGVNTVKYGAVTTFCCKSNWRGCRKRCPKYLNVCEKSTFGHAIPKKIKSILDIGSGNFLYLDQYGAVYQYSGEESLVAGTSANLSRIDITAYSYSVNFQPECNNRIQNNCDTSKRSYYSSHSFWTNHNPATVASCGSPFRESVGAFPRRGYKAGALTASMFNTPLMAIPAKEGGTLIVADTGNNVVRKVNFNENLTYTIAGNHQTYDLGDGGLATSASIYHPRGVAVDTLGNLYISSANGYIRRVNPSGYISTIAGKPLSKGGSLVEAGPMANFNLKMPSGMVLDEDNNLLYVADTGNHRIVRMDLSEGKAQVVAGNGQCILGPVKEGLAALETSICSPTVIALDASKNLLYLDKNNKKIRRVLFNSDTNGIQRFASSALDNSELVRYADGSFDRIYRDGTVATFNAKGLHVQTSDLVGRSTIFGYDERDLLTSIQDPSGSISKLQYYGDKLSSFIDPAGRKTQFIYNGNELVQVFFPDSTGKSFGYNEKGLLVEETNQRNLSTLYYYNQWNRLSGVRTPDNAFLQLQDTESKTFTNAYDAGNYKLVNYSGADSDKLSDSVVNAKGAETTFVKETNGFVSIIKDAEGKETKIDRDQEGRPIKITRPDGTHTQFTYNQNTGDLLTRYESSTNTTESFFYNDRGQLVKHIDPLGRESVNSYDLNTGLLLSEINPLGLTTSRTYGTLGLLATVTNHLGLTQSYEYDPEGNLIKSTTPMGESTLLTRDDAGNVIAKTNAKNQTTNYSYDLFNRLLSVTTPSNKTTSYQYLPTGELTLITNPVGHLTEFTYDALGRLTQKKSPIGQITKLSYDKNGNVIKEVDPNGNTKSYEYDILDQLVKKVLPDNTYAYTYTDTGKLQSVADNDSAFSFSYVDIHGEQYVQSIEQQVLDIPTNTISHSYNAAGKRIGLSSSFISFSYSYDNSYRLIGAANSKGESFSFGYDSANRLVSITRPNSITTTNTFDANSFLTQILHKNSSGTLANFDYTRDAIGNRSTMTTKFGTHNYQYDDEGQLIAASHPEASALHQLEKFTYDDLGNRLTDNQGSFSYDDKKYRLEEDYRYIYAYDQNGNLVTKQEKGLSGKVWNFVYSSENQLVSVDMTDQNSSSRVEYSYDALGRRTQKKVIRGVDVQVNKYVYDSSEIIAELDEDNSVLATYTHSGLRTDDVLSVNVTSAGVGRGLASTTGSYQYLKDGLGSIVDIADSNGTVVQHYAYSAFGKILKISDKDGNDISANPVIEPYFTFAGREWDAESGLYFNRARYYSPDLGRFISVDPDPGKLSNPITFVNKYIYGNNNPIMMTDPTGRFGFLAAVGVTLLYTGVISAIQAEYQSKNGGGSWSDNFWKNWAINFGISMIGLGAHAAMSTNASYSLGWGGVYSGTSTGASGFSAGFFQSTPGSTAAAGQLYWHEVGHAINFGLFNTFTQGGNSLKTRLGWNAGFYLLHGIGSYGGKHNPATALTEGGADVWSAPKYGFGESSGYVGFGSGVSPFSWW